MGRKVQHHSPTFSTSHRRSSTSHRRSAPVTDVLAPVTDVPALVTDVPALVTDVPAPVTDVLALVTDVPALVTDVVAPVTDVPALVRHCETSDYIIILYISLVANPPLPLTKGAAILLAEVVGWKRDYDYSNRVTIIHDLWLPSMEVGEQQPVAQRLIDSGLPSRSFQGDGT